MCRWIHFLSIFFECVFFSPNVLISVHLVETPVFAETDHVKLPEHWSAEERRM